MSIKNEWIKIDSYDEEFDFEERASVELKNMLKKLLEKYQVNFCNDEVTLLIQVVISKPINQDKEGTE